MLAVVCSLYSSGVWFSTKVCPEFYTFTKFIPAKLENVLEWVLQRWAGCPVYPQPDYLVKWWDMYWHLDVPWGTFCTLVLVILCWSDSKRCVAHTGKDSYFLGKPHKLRLLFLKMRIFGENGIFYRIFLTIFLQWRILDRVLSPFKINIPTTIRTTHVKLFIWWLNYSQKRNFQRRFSHFSLALLKNHREITPILVRIYFWRVPRGCCAGRLYSFRTLTVFAYNYNSNNEPLSTHASCWIYAWRDFIQLHASYLEFEVLKI